MSIVAVVAPSGDALFAMSLGLSAFPSSLPAFIAAPLPCSLYTFPIPRPQSPVCYDRQLNPACSVHQTLYPQVVSEDLAFNADYVCFTDKQDKATERM